MVNTFLTYADYQESARNLNHINHVNQRGRHGARLWKQVLESHQIITLISDLHILGKYYNIPLPSDKTKHKEWVKQLKKRYFDEEFIFASRYGILEKITKPNLPKRKQQTDYLKTTLGKAHHIINLGWCFHPIVYQWLAHLDSLKEYHDAHLKVWLERGYKTVSVPFGVKNAPRPAWTEYAHIHKNHRAALLNKEQTRGEDPWYINMTEFVNAGEFTEYIYE